MSIVTKLHCDLCGRDESIPLNHVWTVAATADALKVYRGFAEDVEGAAHICSADCLAKYAARWAADPHSLKSQISNPPHQESPV